MNGATRELFIELLEERWDKLDYQQSLDFIEMLDDIGQETIAGNFKSRLEPDPTNHRKEIEPTTF